MTTRGKLPSTPVVVATGFTTAFLGDERTLREFIIGEHTARSCTDTGDNAVLYLINDSYDPLDERQLRVAVNKDPRLIRQFEPFCGRPISEIPDPYGCHAHYSAHYTALLLDRLHALDIHPVVLDAYQAYRHGHYAEFVTRTLTRYADIQNSLARVLKNERPPRLFRPICPGCSTLDATDIRRIEGKDVHVHCERCGQDSVDAIPTIQGKLSWKVDCAVRWNLYRIDIEVFSKAHMARLGTLHVSRYMSRNVFGGRIPNIVRYGDVIMSRDMSGQILRVLPPEMIHDLFLGRLQNDLVLTRDSVEQFCHRFEVRPGTTFAAFIKNDLPKRAIGEAAPEEAVPRGVISETRLVKYGNAFSEFYYGRQYGLRFPSPELLAEADPKTLGLARDVVGHAVLVRQNGDTENARQEIKAHLFSIDASKEVYHFLRRALGQENGPNIATVLAIVPIEPLRIIHMLLGGRSAVIAEESRTDEETRSKTKSKEPVTRRAA
jgi:hypothetical protein